MGKIFVALAMVLGLSILFESMAPAREGKHTFVAELSPLRTALGAPEFRLETSREFFGIAAIWNQERRPSQRSDFTDSSQIIRIEGLWYPAGVSRLPLYFGAGLQNEEATIGREQERSHITWARTADSERNDEWINHDSYFSLTQSIGYRYFAKSLVTASISGFRDELLTTNSRNEKTGAIYSSGVDLDTRGRRSLRSGILMQVGVYFR